MSEVIAQELPHRPGADRRGLRTQPRPRDRQGAADGRGGLVHEPRDGAGRRQAARRTGTSARFVNTDVIGTEFGGVLKNLIAVAIGIVDGVGYGENTKASIITRGLVEMTDFAVAYGAQAETLSGLAGLGDLIATCESPLSRNNTAGRLLGQGLSFADVVKQMKQTTEGLASVGPILELAQAKGVEMPIVEQVRQVLAGTLKPADIAPHLTTDSDEPQGERNLDDGQAQGGAAVRRSLKRALDQLRNGGGRALGD